MAAQLKISVIVATFNRGELLLRTLRSIAEQDLEPALWEGIIVNNNSTDDTHSVFELFLEQYPSVSNIRMVFEGRQGLSHARNKGISESRGEYIVIIDDDEQMNVSFLRRYMEFFDSHPDAYAAGGRIVPLYEYETPKWLSPYLERPLAAKIDLGPDVKLFGGEHYPIGGNMAFRASVFNDVGTFDPELGRTGTKLLGGEEKDLFVRIKNSGGLIYWVPGPTISHLIPRSRLTREYLVRLSRMIGYSERMRTLSVSKAAYRKRLFAELIKWAGTSVIALGYLIKLKPSKAGYLFILRWNITRGLIGNV